MSKPSSNDLRLEQALLSELPEGVRLPDDQAESLAALRRDNEAILDKYPAERVAKEIERRLAAERAPRRLWLWSPAVLAPALALAMELATKQMKFPTTFRVLSQKMQAFAS